MRCGRAPSRECADTVSGELRRIVVAVDPPATATKTSDACGIVAGRARHGGVSGVLADARRCAQPSRRTGPAPRSASFHRLGRTASLPRRTRVGTWFEPSSRRRSGCAVEAESGQPAKVGEGRAGRRTLPSGEGAPCGTLCCAGGVVVPLFGPDGLSAGGHRPARCARLGYHRADPRISSRPRVRDFR